MKTTIELNRDDVADIIETHLSERGYKPLRPFSFEVDRGFPGIKDPRESTEPSFRCVRVSVQSDKRSSKE